jgi:hypothetical protein
VVLRKHAKALEGLGVPLASAKWEIDEFNGAEEWAGELYRVVPSLVLGELEGGGTFGAFIAIGWPKLGSTAKDEGRRSFLFTVDGPESRRFATVTPATIGYDLDKLCVGELTVDLTTRSCWTDTRWSCTGGHFPALSGKLETWGIWRL